MPHSYSNLLTHIVYSTKNRRPLIDSALESRLFPYFGGILRQLGGKLYTVNGVENHVHILAEMPPTIAVAEAIGKIKGSSTHWIHESIRVLVAAGVRCIQRQQVERRDGCSIHRTTEDPSQEAIVSGRVCGALETTWRFDR
jgi:REP element-mobilizing transposase RayT